MPDWKSPETLERLLSAIIASNGGKVDNMAVARFFNDTYYAVENRTRIYKKQAQALIQDATDSGRIDQDMHKRSSVPNTPRKSRTPKKALDLGTITNGRITKNSPTKSPSKKNVVKQENTSTESSDYGEPNTGTSFQFDNMNFGDDGFDWGGNGVA